MKYTITIEEYIVQGWEIEAPSMEMAMAEAERKYIAGELVLTPGEVVHKEMCGYCKATGEETEWTEF